MKVGVIQPAIRQTAFAAVVGVNLLIAPKVPAQPIVPAAVASPPPAQVTMGTTAEVERVIVTGSNIPSLARTFQPQKKSARTRWIRIVRQTSKNWAFAMQRI